MNARHLTSVFQRLVAPTFMDLTGAHVMMDILGMELFVKV